MKEEGEETFLCGERQKRLAAWPVHTHRSRKGVGAHGMRPRKDSIFEGVLHAGASAPHTMKMFPLNVIPAKAGIHAIYPSVRSWIPAFAGMTA
jgi:hypothetical protein